jgi:hypothetical protein
MSNVPANRARIGWISMLAVLMVGVMCGECAGQAGRGGLRPLRRHVSHVRPLHGVPVAAHSLLAPSELAPMRYYGGPKSPMWRG